MYHSQSAEGSEAKEPCTPGVSSENSKWQRPDTWEKMPTGAQARATTFPGSLEGKPELLRLKGAAT